MLEVQLKALRSVLQDTVQELKQQVSLGAAVGADPACSARF